MHNILDVHFCKIGIENISFADCILYVVMYVCPIYVQYCNILSRLKRHTYTHTHSRFFCCSSPFDGLQDAASLCAEGYKVGCAQGRVLAPLLKRPWRPLQRGRPYCSPPQTSFSLHQPLKQGKGGPRIEREAVEPEALCM